MLSYKIPRESLTKSTHLCLFLGNWWPLTWLTSADTDWLTKKKEDGTFDVDIWNKYQNIKLISDLWDPTIALPTSERYKKGFAICMSQYQQSK